MRYDLQALKAHYGEKIYPASVRETADTCVLMVDLGAQDALVVAGAASGFHGKNVESWLECPLDHENGQALRAAYPFTAPVRGL